MEKGHVRRKGRCVVAFGAMLIVLPVKASGAERLHTAYFSPAPGASAVIWVAKEARLFEKHGLDVAPVLIPSSVRTLQAILAGESPIAESAGPAAASARLAGGDIVALAGSVNILTYYFVTLPNIKKPDDLRGKIGANQSPGTIADFALRVSLRKIGLDPIKDVSLRSIGVLYDRIAAMQKGIVQFTVVTEAEKPVIDKLGYSVLLDLISLKIPFPQRGVYTTGRHIREQTDTVRRYVRAYVEAIHYFKTRKEETIQILPNTRAWRTAASLNTRRVGLRKICRSIRIRRSTVTKWSYRKWFRAIRRHQR